MANKIPNSLIGAGIKQRTFRSHTADGSYVSLDC
jgi:hypothetical protein